MNQFEILDESLSYLNEGILLSEKDILYNKEKFDSGKINLCFITGHSGSGKSTMAHNAESDNIEVYELDDVIANKINFTMDNLKEYGNLIYNFFKGEGKKYYYIKEDIDNKIIKPYNGDYDNDLINDFIKAAIQYSKTHKNIKIIVEGIELFLFVEPSLLKEYAVYIKGTSKLKSDLRAAKRDSKNEYKDDIIKRTKSYITRFKKFFTKDTINLEKKINKYREYFQKIINQ